MEQYFPYYCYFPISLYRNFEQFMFFQVEFASVPYTSA